MFRKIRAVACSGLLFGAVWAGTSATFTNAPTGTSTFSSGTIDLELADDATDAYSFTSLSFSNMKPGDVKYASLKIENAGTLGFTYVMSTSATNADSKDLRSQLLLGIKGAPSATCDATVYGNSVDTMYTQGVLSSAAVAARSLSAATTEYACFQISLPSGVGNLYQGATTTATFTFTATQL
jgi:hypothetical protein